MNEEKRLDDLEKRLKKLTDQVNLLIRSNKEKEMAIRVLKRKVLELETSVHMLGRKK